MNKNTLLVGGVIVALLFSALAFIKPIPVIVGTSAGPFHTELQEFAGGVRYSHTLSTTTTGTARTLKQGDFDGYDVILPRLNGGNDTWTFPASSTLTSFLPHAGDMQRTCIYNSSSSYTLTLAASTGIDLKISTSTYRNLTIGANGGACLTFVRGSATTTKFDLGVFMTGFEDAD